MDKKTLTVSIGLLFLLGCGSGGPHQALSQNEQKVVNLAEVSQIKISAGSGGGIPGASTLTYEILLEKDRDGKATITRGNNWNSRDEIVKEYTLPPSMFRECRELLLSTRFFEMKSVQPEVLFENSSSGIRVECGGQAHVVNVVSPATPPAGYEELLAFLEKVEKQGNLIKQVDRGEQGP